MDFLEAHRVPWSVGLPRKVVGHDGHSASPYRTKLAPVPIAYLCGTPAIKETQRRTISGEHQRQYLHEELTQKNVAKRSTVQAGRENPRSTNLRLHTHALTDSSARNQWAYILTLLARTCVSVVERQMALNERSYLENARGRSAKMKGYFDDSDEEDNNPASTSAAGAT